MSNKVENYKNWEKFNKKKSSTNYPKWPNEAMVKLVFGDYLENKININSNMKVLDVGCGFGNNLLPFLELGCDCYGTEVTKDMAEQTEIILKERGYNVKIEEGKNNKLPFEDDFFDLLLSIGVIHYEGNEENLIKGLKEYNRVLKKYGRLLLITVAPEHVIIKKAKLVDKNIYKIQNYDFRDGIDFYCFNDKEVIKSFYNNHFNKVEVGRLTEDLMKFKLDFFLVSCEAKK